MFVYAQNPVGSPIEHRCKSLGRREMEFFVYLLEQADHNFERCSTTNADGARQIDRRMSAIGSNAFSISLSLRRPSSRADAHA